MTKTISIKTQLARIIAGVTLLSTFLAFSFSLIYSYRTAITDLKNSMRFTALQFAESSKSPLLFNDSRGARELLWWFRTLPTVTTAVIYDAEDSLFAAYPPAITPMRILQSEASGEIVDRIRGGFHFSIPVVQDEQRFGHFEMDITTTQITRKYCITGLIFLAVFVLIAAFSYTLAMHVQNIISAPILELKQAAGHIIAHADYSIRIARTCNNEIGLLQTEFDTMVLQLDKSIGALRGEIDSRKKAQHEAQHLRIYLQNIMDAISSAIVAVDRDGCIQQMNFEVLRLIGTTRDDLQGRPVTDILEQFSGHADAVFAAIRENAFREFTTAGINPKTQQHRQWKISLFPLFATESEGVVIVIEDITEKVRMEAMMIQSEKMLSLGGLAAGMAHEINNPLGIISLGVQNIMGHLSADNQRNRELATAAGLDPELLRAYLDSRKIIHYLEGVRNASQRASAIVANMLQFSRTAPGSKSRVNIHELVDQTILLASNEYELKKKYDFNAIRIVREYAPHLPTIFCNATEIQQVVLNLLKNASHALYDKKFTGEETARIIVRLQGTPQGGVCIEIEDNGPGIPQMIRNKIFEPFFTTKEVGLGTGLGLSVSYFIITKNHGGTIDFTSEEGVGTRFVITMPAWIERSVS